MVCLKWPHGLTPGNLSAAPSTVLAAIKVFLAYKLCYLTHSKIPVSLYWFFAPGGKKKVIFLWLKAYGMHICSLAHANTRTHPGKVVPYMA